MAAAFLLMGLGALNDTSITPEIICNSMGVSERRLENALKRIFTSLHRENEE